MSDEQLALGNELFEAYALGDRPRLVEVVRKVWDLLGKIDFAKLTAFLDMIIEAIGGIGLAAQDADGIAKMESVVVEAVGGSETEASAQALNLKPFVDFILKLIALIGKWKGTPGTS